jgi:hypothetical protein
MGLEKRPTQGRMAKAGLRTPVSRGPCKRLCGSAPVGLLDIADSTALDALGCIQCELRPGAVLERAVTRLPVVAGLVMQPDLILEPQNAFVRLNVESSCAYRGSLASAGPCAWL